MNKHNKKFRQRITIKLKPLLKEWMLCKINDYAVSSEKNEILRILAPYISYAPKNYVFKKLEGHEYLTIELPYKFFHFDMQKTLYVSEINQSEFNKTLYLMFRNRFWDYCEEKIKNGSQIKKTILKFCIDNNIAFESINYEALKKDLYRKRKNKNMNRKLSLKCPKF